MYLVQELGFVECLTEPCLLSNADIIMGIYVDDILMTGQSDKVNEFIVNVKKEFNIRVDNEVKDFVGCEMKWESNGYVILHQTRIVEKLLLMTEEERKRKRKV